MDAKIIAAIIGASVGVLGLFFAGFQQWLGYKERSQQHRDNAIFQAFQWFEGGTQKRNIGISIIEGLWHESPHLRGIFVPLLINQAIYLIAEKPNHPAHEKNNLDRIIELLSTIRKDRQRSGLSYRRLEEVMKSKSNVE
ncbi:hypothetical protein [Gimesia aquarii]|uniref:Uncharacterized protein n=1 Tax=Gimesia aquarii TaxID=2527964 RepID=A0A517VP81_9PLAN|nr:hypothetical protein [Gimesia aquarii]QDT94826.1 hypothetical protein V144x_02580 [Gimesia aquarii]